MRRLTWSSWPKRFMKIQMICTTTFALKVATFSDLLFAHTSVGLMTIGKLDGDPEADFAKLVECRKLVSEALNLPLDEIEISMGMSGDYEKAVRIFRSCFSS